MGDRIRNLEVRLGSADPSAGDFTANQACGTLWWGDAPKKGGGAVSVDCEEAVGRYVIVDLPGANRQLELCEVKVAGAYTTPAFSKCKTSVEGMELDLEKLKIDERKAKKLVSELKESNTDQVKKLNAQLAQAKADEATTKKDAHKAEGRL